MGTCHFWKDFWHFYRSRLPSAVEFRSSIMIITAGSTAFDNQLTGLPHNKEGFSGGEFRLYFPTNTATMSNV